MEEKILYEMLIEDLMVDGVFTISIVDEPAIMQDFILLSKDKSHIEIELDKVSDSKRHVLTGPALIPGIIIPRKDFDITFSEETINKISENYLMSNNKDNVDLQHKLPVNKVKMIESWIVDDDNNDKAYSLGYTKEQIPKGTWMVSFKIIDDELWSEYLSSGVLKGFSIAGNFSHREVKMAKEEYDMLYDLYLAVNFGKNDLNTKYKWILGEVKSEACPSCLGFAGKIKKLSDWMNLAIPREKTGIELGSTGVKTNFPHAPYSTFCESKCKCRLVKVAESKHGVKVIKPF